MKYKLIAMDMDGTLLNSRKEISKPTQQALHKAAETGCYITLSTGRSLPAITRYIRELPLNAPLILYNGAMVAETDGKTLFHQRLPKDAVKTILASPYAPKNIALWQDNALFLSKRTEETLRYERSSGIKGDLFPSPVAFLYATKILWIDEPASLNARRACLSENLPETVSCCNSTPNYLEFFSSLVSKGTALHFLCNHLGVSPKETIAFGDGENDVPLLNAAGLSIAMGNASSAAKAKADYITGTNDEDGIASALNRFL